MNKLSLLLALSTLTLALTAFDAISAEAASSEAETKSVAWYVANIKEAQAKNQQCHDHPNLQASADCANALHALQISFNGGN